MVNGGASKITPTSHQPKRGAGTLESCLQLRKDFGGRSRCPSCITVTLPWTSQRGMDRGYFSPNTSRLPSGGCTLRPRTRHAEALGATKFFTAQLAALFLLLTRFQGGSIASTAGSLCPLPVDNRWVGSSLLLIYNGYL